MRKWWGRRGGEMVGEKGWGNGGGEGGEGGGGCYLACELFPVQELFPSHPYRSCFPLTLTGAVCRIGLF